METGAKIGTGPSEELALDATNREIIRQRILLKVKMEKDAIHRGIAKTKYDIGRYEQSRGSDGGPGGGAGLMPLRPQKTYGTGICPKHGEFTRTNANQGKDSCPHLSCCQERRVARVKAIREKRKVKA